MDRNDIPRATLGRLPLYLRFLKTEVSTDTISATKIANGLGLGEVLVRKDLGKISSGGRPKIGYNTEGLIADIEDTIGVKGVTKAVIIGAGKLGKALLGYDGFWEYGLQIGAAFDRETVSVEKDESGKKIYPMKDFAKYVKTHSIKMGLICVEVEEAQGVADIMVESGITAILNFAPCTIEVPYGVTVRREDIALSLAHLKLSANL
jgi:redox-sensing transcriptional repressor